MNNKKITIIAVSIIVFSFILGLISNDLTYGLLALISGSLNIFLQTQAKTSNYIFGCLYNISNAIISYNNHLYGLFILSILLYLPLNIIGFIAWKKDDNNNFKCFNLKKSIIIISTSIISSFIFGLLLNLIPNQRLEFLDSTSNILNIFGMILLNKKQTEGWYILLFNNIVDLTIWIVNYINNTPNSFMMFVVSLMYLVINIYAIYKWKTKK